LARSDHDHPQKTGVNRTRRGRAPAALQVKTIAGRSREARGNRNKPELGPA
jgi:hypothetical protein